MISRVNVDDCRFWSERHFPQFLVPHLGPT